MEEKSDTAKPIAKEQISPRRNLIRSVNCKDVKIAKAKEK